MVLDKLKDPVFWLFKVNVEFLLIEIYLFYIDKFTLLQLFYLFLGNVALFSVIYLQVKYKIGIGFSWKFHPPKPECGR